MFAFKPIVISGALLAFLLMFVEPRPIRAASINLLNNPGFETGDLADWQTGGNSIGFGVGCGWHSDRRRWPVFAPSQAAETGMIWRFLRRSLDVQVWAGNGSDAAQLAAKLQRWFDGEMLFGRQMTPFP